MERWEKSQVATTHQRGRLPAVSRLIRRCGRMSVASGPCRTPRALLVRASRRTAVHLTRALRPSGGHRTTPSTPRRTLRNTMWSSSMISPRTPTPTHTHTHTRSRMYRHHSSSSSSSSSNSSNSNSSSSSSRRRSNRCSRSSRRRSNRCSRSSHNKTSTRPICRHHRLGRNGAIRAPGVEETVVDQWASLVACKAGW